MDTSIASAPDLAQALLERLAGGDDLDKDTKQHLREAIAEHMEARPTKTESLEDLADKQRQVAMALLVAYQCFSVEDAMKMEKIFEHRTADCVQVSLPKSAGIPDRTNKQYRRYLQEMVLNDLAPFEGEVNIIQPIVSDADSRIAVAKVHGQVQTEGRLPIHDHTVWFMYFTESRDKVRRIEVWVDSKQAYDFRHQLTAWQKEELGPSCSVPKSTATKEDQPGSSKG